MAYTPLFVTAPTGTTYDSENPTQGTEELNMTLHAILTDMEDAGTWYLSDSTPTSAEINTFAVALHHNINVVFDYANQAITGWRASETPGLSEPAWDDLYVPSIRYYPECLQGGLNNWLACMQMMFKIYYMWETEEDPLRVKDYIRDMLLAWPLQDITLDLADDGGNQIRVHPLSHLTET